MSTLNPAEHLVTTHEHGAAHAQRAHHEIGFVKKYIFSTDHKIIGIQFLFTTLLMLFVGVVGCRGPLATGVSVALKMPIIGTAAVRRPRMEAHPPRVSYTMLFTMHATVMIFLVIIPILAAHSGISLDSPADGGRRYGLPDAQHAELLVHVARHGLFPDEFLYRRGAAAAGRTLVTPVASASTPARRRVRGWGQTACSCSESRSSGFRPCSGRSIT